MIVHEPDYDRALGIRPSVSAVIFDRRGRLCISVGRLPAALLANHRIRIRDARARRAAPFVR